VLLLRSVTWILGPCRGLVLTTTLHHQSCVQCESKKSPLKFSGIFSQTVGNFSIKFYTPIVRSYVHSITNFFSITCSFDEVMPYYARPPSSHHMRKMFTTGQNACWHFLPFFPNSWEFLVQILCAYYVFLSTLEDKVLFNYLQLWLSYAILSVTPSVCFSQWWTFWA